VTGVSRGEKKGMAVLSQRGCGDGRAGCDGDIFLAEEKEKSPVIHQ